MPATVILVAAGSGTRFKAALPKALVRLNRLPLVAHSLEVFQRMAAVKGVVVVSHPEHLRRFQTLQAKYTKVCAVVPGGATRRASVQCGLAAAGKGAGLILVHDAARPLMDAALAGRVLAALKTQSAVIPAVPVKATIKQVDPKTMTVVATPRRDLLWDVQTPQGFRAEVLARAHARSGTDEATDDAMMVEAMGVKVKVVLGDYRNIKITTPEDLLIARQLLRTG